MMDEFTRVIKSYLEDRASKDSAFAQSFAKEGKSIDECVKFILSEVRKSGREGFADEEIYGMAVHYYDEDGLKYDEVRSCKVVVNSRIELSEEDKEKARQEAYDRYVREQREKLQAKKVKSTKTVEEEQPTLLMKPKTKLQIKIAGMSGSLKPLSEKQEAWAMKQLEKKMYIRDWGRQKWCPKCGHIWRAEKASGSLKCPNCGKVSKVGESLSKTARAYYYFVTAEVRDGMQLLRLWCMYVSSVFGKKPNYGHIELVRNWITKDLRACAEGRKFSNRDYIWTSDMEIRGTAITPDRLGNYEVANDICPYGKKVLDKFRKYGADKLEYLSFGWILELLHNPRYESAVKCGYGEIANIMVRRGQMDKFWPALKIVMRHNYKTTDWSIWYDTIVNLMALEKDIRNPKFVCPEDLKGDHKKYMDILHARREREWRERERQREIERIEEERLKAETIADEEKSYIKDKGQYLGREIREGGIRMTVIPTVQEFYEIGRDMHICIFKRLYSRSRTLSSSKRRRMTG